MCAAFPTGREQDDARRTLLPRGFPSWSSEMECRTLILLLLTMQTSSCVAELTGDNICSTLVRETVSIRVKVKEPVTIKSYTWCFRIPPRCSKYRTELRDKFKIQHEVRTRLVPSCCQGYAPDKDRRHCVAVCSEGCLHGVCDQPEKCSCEPGYDGQRCHQECKPGWFGASCAHQCPCENDASCHHVNGVCNCTAGWRGARCDVRCAQSTYGEGCLLECHCGESNKCHHITGECEAIPTTLAEEVTSQAAAYLLAGDEGEMSGVALTSTDKLPVTSEVPISSYTSVEDSETDRVETESTTEGQLPTEGISFLLVNDDTAAKMTSVTSRQSVEHTIIPKKEVYFGKTFRSFGPKSSDRNTDSLSDGTTRFTSEVPDSTERPGDHTTAIYTKKDLTEDQISQKYDTPPAGETNDLEGEEVSQDYVRPSERTEHPNARHQTEIPHQALDVLLGDEARVIPGNDLQHLRQVKPTTAGDEKESSEEPEDGGIGGDLLSTSCVSAAVAVALIVTATLIVAVAHWRKSSRMKASPGGSEPVAMAIFAYSGTITDTAFPAPHFQGSQVPASFDDSQPECSTPSPTTNTLQRNEQKQNCDFRDSMTSHYDIPPPARLSLEGKSSAGEPIYEEIPGWSPRGAASFLTFTGVMEASRV